MYVYPIGENGRLFFATLRFSSSSIYPKRVLVFIGKNIGRYSTSFRWVYEGLSIFKLQVYGPDNPETRLVKFVLKSESNIWYFPSALIRVESSLICHNFPSLNLACQ